MHVQQTRLCHWQKPFSASNCLKLTGDLDLAIPSRRLVFECCQRRLPVWNAIHPHRAFSLALSLPLLPSSAGDLDLPRPAGRTCYWHTCTIAFLAHPARPWLCQTHAEEELLAIACNTFHCFSWPSNVTLNLMTLASPHGQCTASAACNRTQNSAALQSPLCTANTKKTSCLSGEELTHNSPWPSCHLDGMTPPHPGGLYTLF